MGYIFYFSLNLRVNSHLHLNKRLTKKGATNYIPQT